MDKRAADIEAWKGYAPDVRLFMQEHHYAYLGVRGSEAEALLSVFEFVDSRVRRRAKTWMEQVLATELDRVFSSFEVFDSYLSSKVNSYGYMHIDTRRRIYENCILQHKRGGWYPLEVLKLRGHEAMINMFTWSESIEGSAFWSAVNGAIWSDDPESQLKVTHAEWKEAYNEITEQSVSDDDLAF